MPRGCHEEAARKPRGCHFGLVPQQSRVVGEGSRVKGWPNNRGFTGVKVVGEGSQVRRLWVRVHG